jgi:hypothetical protein
MGHNHNIENSQKKLSPSLGLEDNQLSDEPTYRALVP